MYLREWKDFHEACALLQERCPKKARYCIRFKPATGELVLKVTNDHQCLKFKTKEAVYLNRFEVLTQHLTASMQNRPVGAQQAAAEAAGSAAQGGASTPSQAPTATEGDKQQQQQANTGSSGKKKKGKKRK